MLGLEARLFETEACVVVTDSDSHAPSSADTLNANNMPVDLAVLTEEKLTGWTVGTKMEHQAAMQVRAFHTRAV